jgi:acyl-CoA thioester hydrolase
VGVSTPYEGRPHAGWDPSAPIDAPLRLHTCAVVPEWADYNDHMTESAYLLVSGDNSDAFFRYFGIDEAYRDAGHSLYTVETHLRNLREAAVGEGLSMTLWVLGVDDKRVHIAHELYRDSDGALIATVEQMLVHVDMAAGRSAPIPAVLRERLDAITAAHSQVPRPDWIGRSIGL